MPTMHFNGTVLDIPVWHLSAYRLSNILHFNKKIHTIHVRRNHFDFCLHGRPISVLSGRVTSRQQNGQIKKTTIEKAIYIAAKTT